MKDQIFNVFFQYLTVLLVLYGTFVASAYNLIGKEQNKDKCTTLELNFDSDCLIQPTHNGFVRGSRKISSASGTEVDVFFGIPYAKPPLGELRFRKPEAVGDWKGVYEATQLPNACSQDPFESFPGFRGEEMWNPNTPVSEDCLYLNLWVPTKFRHNNNNIRNNATVMAWIHGGDGFSTGSSSLDLYDGTTLAAMNDVIVASFNYRLGALGFLYFGTEEAPGNMGLYDQVMAMQWIKDNIHFFGGNPDDITVFSDSDGSGSISSHLLSPVSKHLIKRAIIQSSVVSAPSNHLTAESARNFSFILAKDAGCLNEDFSSDILTLDETTKIVNCLRSVDPQNITKAQWNSYLPVMRYSWAPTIDGVFLPKLPKDILEAGEFNNATEIILGSVKDEGSFFLLYDFLQHFNKDEPSDLKRETFVELINTIFDQFSPLQREAIIFQYTDWAGPENGFLNQKLLSDAIGDFYFTCPVNWFAQKLAEHGSKVYNYHYTHLSSSNLWGSWMGVKHGDSLEFTFGYPLNKKEGGHSYTEDERQFSLKVMKYFTEFAKTGKNPMEKEGKLWPTYSNEFQLYLTLNDKDSNISFAPRATTCAFWNEMIPIYFKHSASQECLNSINHFHPKIEDKENVE